MECYKQLHEKDKIQIRFWLPLQPEILVTWFMEPLRSHIKTILKSQLVKSLDLKILRSIFNEIRRDIISHTLKLTLFLKNMSLKLSFSHPGTHNKSVTLINHSRKQYIYMCQGSWRAFTHMIHILSLLESTLRKQFKRMVKNHIYKNVLAYFKMKKISLNIQ